MDTSTEFTLVVLFHWGTQHEVPFKLYARGFFRKDEITDDFMNGQATPNRMEKFEFNALRGESVSFFAKISSGMRLQLGTLD